MLEEYISPFLEEFEASMLNMCGQVVVHERPYVSEIGAISQGDLSALIEISGDITATVAVSVDKDAAIALADILMGTAHSEIDKDAAETVAEIANIFAGLAKKHFEKVGALNISLPIIIQYGKASAPINNENLRYICVPYHFMDNKTIILSIAFA